MRDEEKSKEQLISELAALRQTLSDLKTQQKELKEIEIALRQSERGYKDLFECSIDGLAIIDAETLKITLCNQRAASLYGFKSPNEAIGVNPLEFIHPEDKDRTIKHVVDDLFTQDLREADVFRTVTKDGKDKWISAVGVVIDYRGKKAALASFRDITQSKLTEDALRQSEEKLRLTFESINDAIIVIDLQGYVLDVNEAAVHIAGFNSKNDVVGFNAFDLISNQDRERVMRDFGARLAGHLHQRFEYTVKPLHGKEFVAEITASSLSDASGNPVGYIALLRDITERKLAEKKLQESEEKYKELVEQEKDIIFSIDEFGTITSVNSAVAVWGYTPVEIIGKPYSTFVPARLLEKLETELRAQLMTRGEVVEEAMGLDKDDHWRPIEFSATVILKDDKFAGVRGIVRDITARKRAEEALKQRNRELATLNKIAEAVSRPVILSRVLRTALDSVLETMHLAYGSIWLLESDSSELHLATAKGSKDLLITIADMNNALKTGKSTVDTYYTDGKPSQSSKTPSINGNDGKSMIGIPLKSKGEILGILGAISDSQALSDDDMRLLETIGDQIAVAIENAQLLEKLNKLSITDALTGLYNRRHFYEVLENEMNRTRRYGRCISLAMIDLNGFKKYNDKFGHASGDVILTEFAKAIKDALRRTDSAFRYGGDEFIVILPSTNAERAKEVIERIKKKWFKSLASQLPATENLLGFSAGIAQFPENAETVDGLVFLIDTALYYAKRGGKQQVMSISDLGTSSLDVLSSQTLDQIYALAATVDTRDPFTYGHSKRVAAIAESLGKAIGLKRDELSELVAAAFLHDIGKVGVADVILTKPGKPEKEEWEAIKKHCAEGAKIIQHVKELAPLAPYILHHHEWYDGSGYPDKLKGEKIPLSARIISVADAYDTMTAQRPYREAISPQEALGEMERCSGTQFDPKLIEALRRISKNNLK